MNLPSKAYYIGRVAWTTLEDGRLMELIEDFEFVDFAGLHWPVPAGIHVDGASIPQPLWSVIGSPFTGKYRNASVIHDYYCDKRIRAWKAVHRVFYEGMIVSGVGKLRAKLMYAAVYFAGPNWSDTVVHNNRVESPAIGEKREYFIRHSAFELDIMDVIDVDGLSTTAFFRSREVMPPKGDQMRLSVRRLEQLISSYDPELDKIDRAIDICTEALEWKFMGKKRRLLIDVEDVEAEN